MSKKAERPQSRHHIMIWDEDWEYLSRRFGRGGEHESLGISGAIRHLIHAKVQGYKLLEAQAVDGLGVPTASGTCSLCEGDEETCRVHRESRECPNVK